MITVQTKSQTTKEETLEMFFVIVSAVAAIVAATLTAIQIKMPFVKNIRFVRSIADKGEPCMNLSFTISTSLLGCKIEYIRVPGYRLRSREFCCVDSSCAVGWLSDVFETSSGEHDKSFSLACFPVSEDWPKPVLELRWKWAFIRSTKRTSLESS